MLHQGDTTILEKFPAIIDNRGPFLLNAVIDSFNHREIKLTG
jgi:hypothetical protein